MALRVLTFDFVAAAAVWDDGGEEKSEKNNETLTKRPKKTKILFRDKSWNILSFELIKISHSFYFLICLHSSPPCSSTIFPFLPEAIRMLDKEGILVCFCNLHWVERSKKKSERLN